MTYAKPYSVQALRPYHVMISGSFLLTGASAPTIVSGNGFSVTRTDVGKYSVVLSDKINSFVSATASGIGSVSGADTDMVQVSIRDYENDPDTGASAVVYVLEDNGSSLALTDGPFVAVSFSIIVSLSESA